MDHTIAVDKLQGKYDACDDEFGLLLIKLFLLVLKIIAEVASRTVLCDKVKIIQLLKAVANVSQGWMNQLG